jgi:hypothetical protein
MPVQVNNDLVIAQPQDVPFNAGDYTASSGTWTVTSGQVTTNNLIKIGNNVYIWSLNINGGSLSGTPAQAKIALPFGLVAAKRVDTNFYGTPQGLATQSLIAAIVAATSQLLLLPYSVLWTSGAMNIEGQIVFWT